MIIYQRMRIELRWRAILALLGMLVFGANAVAAPHGRLLRITVHSSALEHNHVNDSADRDVSIYLPPDYEPVVANEPAEFFLSTTRWMCQNMRLGKEIVRARRMGVPLSVVKDLRK